MVSLTPTPEGALSEEEHIRLHQLEHIIEEGFEGFLQVGGALSEIRDRRLYRTTHTRWEDYCLDKWGLSLSRCNQIIQTVHTYDNLVSAVPQDAALLAQTNEHTLRPLSRLTPELQTVTWELIRRIEERPAGTTIETVVDRINGAISDGWEQRDNPRQTNGSTPAAKPHRSRRAAERPSDRLGSFCKWATQVNLWDPECLAQTDDPLCARRHLTACRQVRTFCDCFIAALEIRLSRAKNLAAV
jgi:hypothetical protein